MQLCNLVMKKMAAIKAFTRLTQVQAILDNAMGFFLSFFFIVFFSFFGNTTSLMFIDQRMLLFPFRYILQICLMRRNE